MDPLKIQPVGPMVLLKTIPKKTQTPEGVHLLQETAEDRVGYIWAEVIRVGSGKPTKSGARDAPQVTPGETVLVRRYLTEVTGLPQNWGLEGHYGFVHQDDLMGVRDGDYEVDVTRI